MHCPASDALEIIFRKTWGKYDSKQFNLGSSRWATIFVMGESGMLFVYDASLVQNSSDRERTNFELIVI